MFALSELVDTDDSGARPAISPTACHGRTTDAMCAVECYSRATWLTKLQLCRR